MPPPPSLGPSRALDLDLHHRPSRARRVASRWRLLLLVGLIGLAVVASAVVTNTFGAGDRFDGLVRRVDRLIAGPVPTRSTMPTVIVTEPPEATASPTPRATPAGPAPSISTAPTAVPTATPLPPRVAVDVDVVPDAEAVFNHEIEETWCAPAGVQMVLTIHGKGGGTSEAFQRELAARVGEWESYEDSRNGKWGPAAMALALEAYGVPGYEVRAYESRGGAMRDAARQISRTGAPVILLTWRGAHTWVMTGFRADADPLVFRDTKLSGAYILDPWYPDISSIWGPSNPPGFFTSMDELVENYLPWQRPEGQYPDRDGLFLAVVPTVPLDG